MRFGLGSNDVKYKFLFAGGGTGGHLFPAVAVAEIIRDKIPGAEILFVGTKSKIEGRVVPKLGFNFKSIWIKGFSRKLTMENLLFPLKIIVSIFQSMLINLKFKPKVAIGSGGYVAGPAIFSSAIFGAKVILIEQNSFPGVTTRMLEKYADEIHISFDDSKKYFKNQAKVRLTGNPIRGKLSEVKKPDALDKFGFVSSKRILLILGGSLGAASLNEAAANSVKKLEEAGLQIIWQTGNPYYKRYEALSSSSIWINPFIDEMNYAYSACNLLLARSGATTIAELLALGIPSILVPSPNVAGNHQYFNAKSLEEKNAAVLIEDKFIKEKLFDSVIDLIFNDQKLRELSKNAKSMAKPDAAFIIAGNAIKLAEN